MGRLQQAGGGTGHNRKSAVDTRDTSGVPDDSKRGTIRTRFVPPGR